MSTPDAISLVPVSNEAVRLSDEDRELVQRALDEIVEAQHALGVETERHMNEAARLKGQIDGKRTEYRALVDVLAKRYLKGPGKLDFRPDIGAFVARDEREKTR